MTPEDVRMLALGLPEAEENSHFGKADFRVRNKIFATLPDTATAVVELTAERQEIMAAAEPKIFSAVPGGWGRQGWTRIALAQCDAATLHSALLTAWKNVAPRRLAESQMDPHRAT